MGISIDHVPCLKAWSESLGNITYPLLSDFWPHGAIAEKYGVLRSVEGHSERAIFVIDKDGVIRYIDVHDIDEQPDNEVLRNVLRNIQASQGYQPIKILQPAEDEELPTGKVVLYCARWCKDCKRARAWLESKGLEYVEVDIDYNIKARSQLRKWGNGALITPTIDLLGHVVLDYKEDKLEEALRKAQEAGSF